MKQSYRFLMLFSSIALAGCAPAAPGTPLAAEQCRPSTIDTSGSSFPEIKGDAQTGELWALLFFGEARAQQELKIVWKVTAGEGPITVQASLDGGAAIEPVWEPQYHDSSTWTRPGDEWGTAFIFPQPGCWTLTVTRGAAIGEIRLEVLAP